MSERREHVDVVVYDRVQQPRREPERVDAAARDESSERARVDGTGGGDHEATAVQERAPNLEGGSVEGERGEEKVDARLAELGECRVADETHDGGMRDRDALRCAGGPRREEDVRERIPRRLDFRPTRHTMGEVIGEAAERRGGVPHVTKHHRVGEHPKTLGRERRIEGNVRTARLQDSEEGLRQRERPLGPHPDEVVSADPACP